MDTILGPRSLRAAPPVLYLLTSFALFSTRVLAAPATRHVGLLTDPSLMIWCMAWWPYAITHRLNPLFTKALWSPIGYNLCWMTSIPAIAVLLAPVTAAFGPVVSYNFAALLAPALSAWAAFLLCRHTTRNWIAAFAGGLVYGFSPYEVGQVLAGHLHLTPVFVPPLCALLVVNAIEGNIGPVMFTAAFAALIVVQTLISTEVLATMTVFGAAALFFCWAMVPSFRRTFPALAGRIVLAYFVAALILSPFLLYLFAPGAEPKGGFFPGSFFSADLLGFVVPGPLMFVHVPGLHFAANVFENGAYFGLPLLLVCGFYLWKRRNEPAARVLAVLFVLITAASLGPVLHTNGNATIPLPWAMAEKLPLIKYALPVRFVNYGFLILALALAMFLSDSRGGVSKPVLAAVLVAFLPNPMLLLHESHYPVPRFFAQKMYHSYLTAGENVLIIPYGISGPSMAWQALSGMYFNMPGGYTGVTPAEFQKWPLLNTLTSAIPSAVESEQLKEFVQTYRISTILVLDGTNTASARLPLALGASPVRIGGVSLYHMQHESNRRSSPFSIELFQRMSAELWFDQLVCAAARFLDSGGDPAQLNPSSAYHLGLLPPSEWSDNLDMLIAGFANGSNNGLWVGPGARGTIEVGIPTVQAAVQALAQRYGSDADRFLFPYPSRHLRNSSEAQDVHLLLTTLKPSALRHCSSERSPHLATLSK